MFSSSAASLKSLDMIVLHEYEIKYEIHGVIRQCFWAYPTTSESTSDALMNDINSNDQKQPTKDSESERQLSIHSIHLGFMFFFHFILSSFACPHHLHGCEHLKNTQSRRVIAEICQRIQSKNHCLWWNRLSIWLSVSSRDKVNNGIVRSLDVHSKYVNSNKFQCLLFRITSKWIPLLFFLFILIFILFRFCWIAFVFFSYYFLVYFVFRSFRFVHVKIYKCRSNRREWKAMMHKSIE